MVKGTVEAGSVVARGNDYGQSWGHYSELEISLQPSGLSFQLLTDSRRLTADGFSRRVSGRVHWCQSGVSNRINGCGPIS